MKPVARATLQAALGSALAKTVPEHIYLQLDALALEEALTAAGAEALDGVRADPVGDRAIALMDRLHVGLAERDVVAGGDVVERALSTIDAFQTALDEAAQGELELISEGLSADQEIRARALDAAVRAWAPLRGSDPEAYADAISDVALAFEEYIRDGVPEERGSAEERSDDPSKAPVEFGTMEIIDEGRVS